MKSCFSPGKLRFQDQFPSSREIKVESSSIRILRTKQYKETGFKGYRRCKRLWGFIWKRGANKCFNSLIKKYFFFSHTINNYNRELLKSSSGKKYSVVRSRN
jgi:hypothetical protein